MPYATVRIAPQWALVLTEWARQALGQELSRGRIAAALPTHDNTSRPPPSLLNCGFVTVASEGLEAVAGEPIGRSKHMMQEAAA